MQRFEFSLPGLKRLIVLMSPSRFIERIGCDFVGKAELPARTCIQLVQVMDVRTGIVVRRYAYVVNGGGSFSLRVRRPCYSGRWNLLDGQVSKVLGGAPVLDYDIGELGEIFIKRSDH